MADRIIVYGVTGSGKTTLARQIGERTGLPWHSVDDLMWLPGWVGVGADEQRLIAAELCAADKWVLDSAYGQWRDLAMPRAQLIVALDYPRWLSLGRLLKRTFKRASSKQLVCNGNVETWRLAFSRDSIVVWHFRSFTKKHNQIGAWSATPPGAAVVRLTSPAATDRWLETLSRQP